MSDIVERLRGWPRTQDQLASIQPLMHEAADEIERLTAALQRTEIWLDDAYNWVCRALEEKE